MNEYRPISAQFSFSIPL